MKNQNDYYQKKEQKNLEAIKFGLQVAGYIALGIAIATFLCVAFRVIKPI